MAVVVMGLGDGFGNGGLGGGTLGMAFHHVLWSVIIILLQGTKNGLSIIVMRNYKQAHLS